MPVSSGSRASENKLEKPEASRTNLASMFIRLGLHLRLHIFVLSERERYIQARLIEAFLFSALKCHDALELAS